MSENINPAIEYNEEILITLWLEKFGDRPVQVREVLDHAFFTNNISPQFEDILTTLIPALAQHPHPKVLTNWLTRNENRAIRSAYGTDLYYRFSRYGYQWRLIFAPTIKKEATLIAAD